MDTSSVTRKGQVTIPKSLRQKLGIRQGGRIEFLLVDDCVQLRVVSSPPSVYGLLKSKRPAVPADFDRATLLRR
ncbi:MAG: AbrB/MazE/SpoVT family DNA-binding domain-containing protein [Burkholderiales bacterium]|nr:AbrB/MazE/SpoVT family DNA-binding domain-containing protein [Burkholderiales bacterium]